jgi:hypothetical protein
LIAFASKVDWEGGVYAALEYGLSADELPEGHPELEAIWREMERKYADLEQLIAEANGWLPE